MTSIPVITKSLKVYLRIPSLTGRGIEAAGDAKKFLNLTSNPLRLLLPCKQLKPNLDILPLKQRPLIPCPHSLKTTLQTTPLPRLPQPRPCDKNRIRAQSNNFLRHLDCFFYHCFLTLTNFINKVEVQSLLGTQP